MTRAEPERVADKGEAYAGVAGSSFHDRAARAQLAAPDRILDDVERGAVLDGLAGVHEFGLAEDAAACLLRGAFKLDQRRVADGLDDPVTNAHALPLSSGSQPEQPASGISIIPDGLQ